jgi:hypothetical protein
MNIDERLDRLVERHEALTQTVEHLALQGEEQSKLLRIQGEHIARQGEHIVRQGEQIARQGEHIDRMLTLFEKDGESIRSLARIAEIHDRRISGLEGGKDVS